MISLQKITMPKPKQRQGEAEQPPKAKGWQAKMNARYRELMASGKLERHLPFTVNRRQEKIYDDERKRQRYKE